MNLNRQILLTQLSAYHPFNEQEAADLLVIRNLLQTREDIFNRSSKLYHMTASAWVTDLTRTQILMAYHNLYDSWAWLGGHADGEENLLQVALREVREESGVRSVHPVLEDIFSVEILTVDGHWKKGQYVSSHLHLNVTYLLEADTGEALAVKPDENKAVSWFPMEKAVQMSSEPWFREHIYNKLNEKLRGLSAC